MQRVANHGELSQTVTNSAVVKHGKAWHTKTENAKIWQIVANCGKPLESGENWKNMQNNTKPWP